MQPRPGVARRRMALRATAGYARRIMARNGSGARTPVDVCVVDGGRGFRVPDEVAAEEPLEIRLRTASRTRSVAVTMRTPGTDRELTAGFLFCEGVIDAASDIEALEEGNEARGGGRVGFVTATLRPDLDPALDRLDRHFFASSACGVCGKSDFESVVLGKLTEPQAGPIVEPETFYSLAAKLRAGQSAFGATGGLHAAALFTASGNLLAVHEDVGRHNALDKLVGSSLLEGRSSLRGHVVMVSGRASYELVQKCARAEAPILCAVSAPSSLAVSLARRLGLTLVGFLRDRRFNVYAGGERIAGLAEL